MLIFLLQATFTFVNCTENSDCSSNITDDFSIEGIKSFSCLEKNSENSQTTCESPVVTNEDKTSESGYEDENIPTLESLEKLEHPNVSFYVFIIFFIMTLFSLIILYFYEIIFFAVCRNKSP